MAQLVRAPPCHGGGRGFESLLGRLWIGFHKFCLWDLSSAGRASALQAEGHRFEPCRSHSTEVETYLLCRRGGTGRRTGLKILRDLYSRTGSIPVAGIEKINSLRVNLFCFYVLNKISCEGKIKCIVPRI